MKAGRAPNRGTGAGAATAFLIGSAGTLGPRFLVTGASTRPVVRALRSLATGTHLSSRGSGTLRPTMDRLAHLSTLEADWDSYGAAPISATAIERAREVLTDMGARFGPSAGLHARPFAVVPVPDGGVQLEWRGQGRALELEIGPDGQLAYLLDGGEAHGGHSEERSAAGWEDALDAVARVVTPRVSA